MRKIALTLCCVLLLAGFGVANTTINDCKTGTFSNCTVNPGTGGNCSVSYDFTSCSTGQPRVGATFCYTTSCWKPCICECGTNGFVISKCNTCTGGEYTNTYMCDACT
jgi:hypothetical protein